MKAAIETIVTARLILRSPLPSDFPILFDHIFTDAAVMRHTFAGQPFSLQRATAFFEEKFDHHVSGTKLGVLTSPICHRRKRTQANNFARNPVPSLTLLGLRQANVRIENKKAPRKTAGLLIWTHEEEIRSWQAWQRPTLPSLET